ncbi:MAG: hypothetical protein AB7H86_22185 [Blastocatellales bacterium]
MAWIRTIPFEEADGKIRELVLKQRELYPKEYDSPPPHERLRESIVTSHSLIPPAMYHMFAGLGELLSPELPLTRSQHEMIATLVSAVNDCFY